MKKEDLFEAIGECDDTLLRRSEKRGKRKKKHHFLNILPMAAAAALIVVSVNMQGLDIFQGTGEEIAQQEETQPQITQSGETQSQEAQLEETQPQITQSGETQPQQVQQEETQPEEEHDASIGGCGEETERDKLEEKKEYGMDLESEFVTGSWGPILPLTLAEENEHISANRDLNFDFIHFDSFENEGSAVITDTYTLENHSQQDQVVQVTYPYLTTLADIEHGRPVVSINGEEYPLNIRGERYYAKDSSGSLIPFGRMLQAEEYNELLKDESTRTVDFEFPLLDEKVIVYEYQNYDMAGMEDACYATEIKLEDTENLYTANMNAAYVDGEKGVKYYGFTMEEMQKDKRTPMLIFYGEEPTEYKEHGYDGLNFSSQNEKSDIHAEMVRYESTFGEVLKKLVDEEIANWEKEDETVKISNDLYYQIASIMLSQLIEERTEAEGSSEDNITEIWDNDISNLVYLAYEDYFEYMISNEIVIPAGETVTYQITYEREGNHDSTVPEQEFLGRYGYDNLIHAGTNLNFVQQNASINDHGYIEIVDQNYGFDLENGIKEVSLDMNIDYYYLVVKRIE